LTLAGVASQDAAMDADKHPPSDQPPQPDPAEQAMQTLLHLRDQMQHLHAELEYIQLMLRLGLRS
jgi:hypothetical protein